LVRFSARFLTVCGAVLHEVSILKKEAFCFFEMLVFTIEKPQGEDSQYWKPQIWYWCILW